MCDFASLSLEIFFSFLTMSKSFHVWFRQFVAGNIFLFFNQVQVFSCGISPVCRWKYFSLFKPCPCLFMCNFASLCLEISIQLFCFQFFFLVIFFLLILVLFKLFLVVVNNFLLSFIHIFACLSLWWDSCYWVWVWDIFSAFEILFIIFYFITICLMVSDSNIPM